MKQLFCQQKEQSSHGCNHSGMKAFRQKCQGEEQPTGIEPAPIVADLQHAEHGEGEQQKIQAVRISGPCQMRFERKIVGA